MPNHHMISLPPPSTHVLIPPGMCILDQRIGRTTLHGPSFGSTFARCVKVKSSRAAASPCHMSAIATKPNRRRTSIPRLKYTSFFRSLRFLLTECSSRGKLLNIINGLLARFYTSTGPNRKTYTIFRPSLFTRFRMATAAGTLFQWTKSSTFY